MTTIRRLTRRTPHQSEVLAQIRRITARGAVARSDVIGSPGACAKLLAKGYITREVDSVGPRGGIVYRYVVAAR